ncbi:MAG TPA: hypothetical protein VGO61_00215 [Steroidobacteraceae bacterium]|nr:hypothetical protein [Steroidobacteraceae bacterium]
MNYDDETLMAYADGELDAVQRAQIAAAIENDVELAKRVEQQRALRSRLAGAFAKVLDEPVPERLENAARAGAAPAAGPRRGKVLQFPARAGRAPGPPWSAREWTAMAASLVLGVLLSWRLSAPADSSPVVAGKDALLARGELARALESQLASEQRGEEPVLIGLTFKARDGNFCRSFVMHATRTTGLACRVGSDWQVAATDSSAAPQGDLQQASSALTPAILRVIEARADGPALDAAAEQSARLSGWSGPRPAGS